MSAGSAPICRSGLNAPSQGPVSVSCRKKNTLASAAQELHDALMMPYDIDEFAKALGCAVDMPRTSGERP